MQQTKGTYPILKYPIKIEQKLKARSKTIIAPQTAAINDEDAYAHLFPPLQPRKPRRYPHYVLWGSAALWVFIFAGVILKVVSGGLLVAAAVVTFASLGVALKQIWADSKITAAKVDRSKALSTPPTEDKPIDSAIDWSENVRELTRSNKTSTAQVGVSEERFLAHMKKHLPGQISFGHTYLPQGYSHPYSADMEIILPCGLGIQVEIDEPYVGKSREPHHCSDNDKDTNRDRYFLAQGWVIIRFSEKQVVTNPEGACGAIASLIFELTQDPCVLKVMGLADTLDPDPQWDSNKSRMMEKLKFREKYLEVAGLWNSNRGKK